MFNKKIYVLVMMVLLAMSSVCFADNNTRWEPVYGDEKIGIDIYFDKATHGVDLESKNFITCDIKITDQKINPYIVRTDITINPLKYREWNAEHSVVTEWKTPSNGSIKEAALKNVIKWVTEKGFLNEEIIDRVMKNSTK